jgi:hypothetical protein
MRTIRASEIGAFLFCQRAWRLRLDGYEPENQAELASGTELHYRHGRTVMLSGCLRTLAYILILIALAVLAFYAAGQVL